LDYYESVQLAREGDSGSAKKLLEALNAPDDDWIHSYNLAVLNYWNRDWIKAEELLLGSEKILVRDSKSSTMNYDLAFSEIYAILGFIHYYQDDIDDALRFYEKSVEYNTDSNLAKDLNGLIMNPSSGVFTE
jgi:tetratricopeptide (TPR) repeat protein